MIEEKPLKVQIEGEEIVIRIGFSALACAAENSPALEGIDAKVIDQAAWAADVVAELEREEEDGTTPVHLLFDAAFRAAMENGADGLHCAEDDL